MPPTVQKLNTLERAGLVRLAQATPDLEYLFRHALVQDAAYQSLLMADRRQFHRTIGDALETLYPERQGELAAALGHHFELAEEYAHALPYFIQAADHAAESFANEEAIALYGKAIDIARKVEVAGDMLPALCQKQGRALEIISDYALALGHYQEMEALALERGDKQLELTAVIGQTTLYTTPTAVSNTETGAIYAERAIALAEELDDQPAHLRILWTLLNLYAHDNDMERAFAIGEKALALTIAQGMHEDEAYLVNDLSRFYIFTGDLRRAESHAARARQLWRELNNLPMLTDSLATSGIVAYEGGMPQRAIAFTNEGNQIGISINNLQAQSYNLTAGATSYFTMGRIDAAFNALETSLQLARQIDFAPIETIALAYLALAYARCGDMERGLATAQEAYTVAETRLPRNLIIGLSTCAFVQAAFGKHAEAKELIAKIKADDRYNAQVLVKPWSLQVEVQILLQEGDFQGAFDVSTRLKTILEGYGNLAYMPQALLLQGQALAALWRWDEARQAAEQGTKTAVSTQNLFLHWQLLAFQSRLQAQQGNQEEAETLRHEAETIVNEIAANCPPDLRESFLNMPAVTAVFHPQQP